MVLSSCLLVLIVCIACLTTQRHVNSVNKINVKLMVNFPKRVTKIFVLLKDLQMEYTTGIVLLSVAVLVSIYCDTYHIALYVSRYVSYRMTAVSSQP